MFLSFEKKNRSIYFELLSNLNVFSCVEATIFSKSVREVISKTLHEKEKQCDVELT